MQDFRLALAQIRPTLGDLEQNLAVHLAYVERAASEAADVVVFPEQSLTGYFLSDLVTTVALRRDDPRLDPLREASTNIDIVFGRAKSRPRDRNSRDFGPSPILTIIKIHFNKTEH